MRRVLVFAMALSLLGLTSAVASSFDANTEDVQSFTTPVSLTVPLPPVPLPPILYLRGPGDGSGTLDPAPPAADADPVHRYVELGITPVRAQIKRPSFVVWRSLPAPPGGWLLHGDVTFFIDQDGENDDLLTAGLLSCDAVALPASPYCDQIADEIGSPGSIPSLGFEQRTVHFGALDEIIPAGHELRLKIVNQSVRLSVGVVSFDRWQVQWGYVPDPPQLPARIEIAP